MTRPCAAHDWGQPNLYHGRPGTVFDGLEVTVTPCRRCNTATLEADNSDELFELLAARLTELGCGP